MLVELREKSQVTLPKTLVKHMGLEAGDYLDVRESVGAIWIVPVKLEPRFFNFAAEERGRRRVQDRASSSLTGPLDAISKPHRHALQGRFAMLGLSGEAFAKAKAEEREYEDAHLVRP
ncbi:MAG: AbrB/MazE/SpoVT family DNA-binding domain-containing protein [Coriobacteriales bacterium]|jgi:bifunctional DNA-binding transcriptional regulator/antitoxin component of YhaV-PrlF toxin-antitoxin module|nr:AbrB/MazE/SpoVT family DNA-binding domain-containing protein [Coriobacteriales bacterium]